MTMIPFLPLVGPYGNYTYHFLFEFQRSIWTK